MIEQPLTIYFDLSQDSRPTIGAVGKAMVEFEKMAGEAVFLLEPGVEFSMVYQFSAPGSLRIIAGLRGLASRERLKTLAIIIATTLVNNGVGHLQGIVMDEAIEAIADEEVTLTEKDIERIVEEVRKVERSETVKAPRREFYRAVEPDHAISGVGAKPNDQKEPPQVIVPREEFAARSVIQKTNEPDVEDNTRVVSERVQVVLVLPPLIESKRQWRVFWDGREIGAKMLDDNFKDQILNGQTNLKLAGGVILEVTLEITQELEHGLWYHKSYAISEVHDWLQSPEQAELLLSHGGDDDDENDQNAQ